MLQLLTVMDTWTKTLDSCESIDTVYLEFVKAFDTVPHRRLIGKLKSLGITGSRLFCPTVDNVSLSMESILNGQM